MPTPEVIDFEKLLAPVSEEEPTGEDLREDPSPTSIYYTIKDARASARAAERQIMMGMDEDLPQIRADWSPILQHAPIALTERTKDLEVVAYYIEALARRYGFAGLRDGFRLARELVERYWDKLYPMPDEDGIETRVGPLVGLNGEEGPGTLIQPIEEIPITEASDLGPYSHWHYAMAVEVSRIQDQKVKDKRVAQGAVSMEMFDKVANTSSATFYQTLIDDLEGCSAEYKGYSEVLDQKCAPTSLPSSNIRNALASVHATVVTISKEILEAAQPAEPETPAEAPISEGDAAPATTAKPAAAAPPGAIVTRDDALKTLLRVAEFFRRTEPHSPLSYALEQTVRWGRMSLPDLWAELIPDAGSRGSIFKMVGIRPDDDNEESPN
ncbi:hypothetical protein Pan216_32870 [Planctomycetes bacterium Pan216]|uniref:ImpA N-terminal domain-containing protein n=1 Tax=Kolteria novifilia TaxID=2527975 RepID=A0A518B614_9BACT|nr:hypothetical protein Pan216_32870 [Planctomycetes bacterium Pan216]